MGAAVEALPIGIAATRGGSRIEYANAHLCGLLGLTSGELHGLDLGRFRLAATARTRVEIRAALLAGASWQGEVELHARGARLHVIETCYPQRDDAGEPAHVGRALHFFHELALLRSATGLSRLVFRDALTGSPNLNLLEELLAVEIARARREVYPFTVLYIDVEHLDAVNAVLGREGGDELLRLILERLRACLRESDTLARVGGDELAILLPRVGDDAAIVVAEKLRRACSGWYEADGKQLAVRVSVGSSVYPMEAENPGELLRRARAAMYRMKAADREIHGLLSRIVGERYALRR